MMPQSFIILFNEIQCIYALVNADWKTYWLVLNIPKIIYLKTRLIFRQLPWHFQPGIILPSKPVGFPYVSSDKPAEKSYEQDGHSNTDAVPLKITLAIAHKCLKVLTKSKPSCIPRVCDLRSRFL